MLNFPSSSKDFRRKNEIFPQALCLSYISYMHPHTLYILHLFLLKKCYAPCVIQQLHLFSHSKNILYMSPYSNENLSKSAGFLILSGKGEDCRAELPDLAGLKYHPPSSFEFLVNSVYFFSVCPMSSLGHSDMSLSL